MPTPAPPISPRSISCAENAPADACTEGRVFKQRILLYTDEGSAVTPKILKAWIVRVESAPGLPKTGRLHVYRHTFASHLAMAGVPAKTIQELCRHASLSITMRYMHLSPSATDEGIAMLTKSRGQGGKAAASRP